VTDPTWQDTITFLRGLDGVPAALANATTLAVARSRWEAQVVARTSMHDLLLTLPGQNYPFAAQVRVQWRDGVSTIFRRQDELLVEEADADATTVDTTLDAVLERLTAPMMICRRCRRPALASADHFEVFERMHYSCFHYEFEHDPFDPDEECTAGDCPSAAISPARTPEEPRDTLVEDLIDALATSELAAQSADARIERTGPGVVDATFDHHAYLITVRTKPRPRS
jgi:hypothetical protein